MKRKKQKKASSKNQNANRQYTKETVRNLLAMGLGTHEQIAKAVNLPIETIEELSAELTAEPVV